MILLLVGATESATIVIREVAKTLSLDVRVGESRHPPAWVMTATKDQRGDALRRYVLPSHRVIEFADLGMDTPLHRDVVQVALSRMSELGPRPRLRAPLAGAIARCALPLLREWATWLAVDEARQKIAAHASFLRSKGGTPPRRLLFLVPDMKALASLRGMVNLLLRERHEVYVALTHTSPGDSPLDTLAGQWGLSVSRAPRLQDSPGRPLAEVLMRTRLVSTGWGPVAQRAVAWLQRKLPLELDIVGFLEDLKPNVLVVVPHRSAPSIEPDYFRTARWLGIRSVCLPLRWDDLEASGGLRHEPPDIFAVWNEEQRRDVIARFRFSAERIQVTGALLPSDIVEGHQPLERDAYCVRMGIDPTRKIILMDAPIVSSREWIARFHEWRQAVKTCADPDVNRAAVVVYVENPEEVAPWRRLASTADISVARAGTDEHRAPFRLIESLMAADVVVATSLALALEAATSMKPTIALLGAEGRGAEDLERFSRAYASRREHLTITHSIPDSVAQLSIALSQKTPAESLRQAAAIVRPHSEDTGAGRVSRLLDELAREDCPAGDPPVRPPSWQRLLVLLCAAVARRLDPSSTGHAHQQPTHHPRS